MVSSYYVSKTRLFGDPILEAIRRIDPSGAAGEAGQVYESLSWERRLGNYYDGGLEGVEVTVSAAPSQG
jgi:hypothetical protein